MLRLTAGRLKGRRIALPDGSRSRPMPAITKNGMFNSIGEAIVGANVLDLFGGSGQLAFEAVSRGAAFAHICELDRRNVIAIVENAERLGIQKELHVHLGHFERIAKKLKKISAGFDLVFADPPYFFYNEARRDTEKIVGPDGIGGLVAAGGAIYLGHPAKIDPRRYALADDLALGATHAYGRTAFTVFVKATENEA